MNESNLEELIRYILSNNQLTDCILLGGEHLHSRITRMIPREIGLHTKFLANVNPPPTANELHSLCREALATNKAELAPESAIQPPYSTDLESTLVIVDSDLYRCQDSNLELAEGCHHRLEDFPYCITVGALEQPKQGRHCCHQEYSGHTLTLQGYSALEDPVTKRESGVWIEFHGRLFKPKQNKRISSLKIAAILIAYNEDDILEDCIRILYNQGIDTYLIDDESTDETGPIATSLANDGILTRYRRSGLSNECEDRWSKLLNISFEIASTIDADWIIHHDVDEVREAPWQGVSLAEGICIVNSLGFNCIDHTVMEFLFTEQDAHQDNVNARHISPFNSLKYFRFPSHKPNFMQLKAWRKDDQLELGAGGHKMTLKNQRVFPLKFLIKHFPLRSLAHAKKKMLKERLTRLSAERAKRGWHNHYHHFQYFGIINAWTRRELHYFNPSTFYHEFIIQRLTGCGIERTDRPDTNINTLNEIIDQQEKFRAQVASLLGIELGLMKIPHGHKAPDLRNYSWKTENDTILKKLNGCFESHSATRQDLADLRKYLQKIEVENEKHKANNSLTREEICSLTKLLEQAHLQLDVSCSQLNKLRQSQAYQAEMINKYMTVIKQIFQIFNRLILANAEPSPNHQAWPFIHKS